MNGAPLSSVERSANGFATASLVLGVLSLCCPCAGCLAAIPGVVCGHLALRQMGSPGVGQSGRDRAIVGLITSYVGMAGILVEIAVVLLYGLLMFGSDWRYLFQSVP